ncbi:MAG: hypothetical protein V7609_1141 [Verrucomicrobiota bacterium]
MKIKAVIAAAGIAGAVIPSAFFGASRLGLYFFGSTFDLILWPSSILLMGEQEVPESLLSYRLVVSVLLNVVYYVAVAAIACGVIVVVQRFFHRARRIRPNN